MEEEKLKGGCICGHVRYQLKEKPLFTQACHCKDCKVCGIHTHNRPRINPIIYGINIACVEGVKPFEIENVPVNDGENHPLDQKK